VSAALVRHVGERLVPVLRELGGCPAPRLPGYRMRILDGNHLAATQHRLKALRPLRSRPLPGQALVVYDPQAMVVRDVVPCEDGHAQERALLGQVLPLVRPRDVWVADRSFCTTDFLLGIASRQAFFVLRRHARTAHEEPQGERRPCGRGATGEVYEQAIRLRDGDGHVLTARPALNDRRIAIYETRDWRTFSPPELALQADALDTPHAEIYGMPVIPYEHMFVGLLWVYHTDPTVNAENKFRMGKVDFGGVSKRVCLDHVQEVVPGDYVLVHVGFALARIDADEARRVMNSDPAVKGGLFRAKLYPFQPMLIASQE